LKRKRCEDYRKGNKGRKNESTSCKPKGFRVKGEQNLARLGRKSQQVDQGPKWVSGWVRWVGQCPELFKSPGTRRNEFSERRRGRNHVQGGKTKRHRHHLHKADGKKKSRIKATVPQPIEGTKTWARKYWGEETKTKKEKTLGPDGGFPQRNEKNLQRPPQSKKLVTRRGKKNCAAFD